MTFYETLTAAIRDIAEHGYDSAERVAYWMTQIREAAAGGLMPLTALERTFVETLTSIFRRQIEQGGILQQHEGVDRFTIERLRPRLRAELDRRTKASADLIKLNREQAIQKTLQRFSGWATSVPIGGSGAVDKNDVKTGIRKALKSLPFEERRVAIDQGHKFVAALNDIIAKDSGALAMVWHSNWRQRNYDYREDHKERDDKTYAIRGNWAIEKGLMNKGDGYLDEITQPAEEPFCRCHGQYLHSLRALPKDMLTKKGREALAGIRLKQREIRAAVS